MFVQVTGSKLHLYQNFIFVSSVPPDCRKLITCALVNPAFGDNGSHGEDGSVPTNINEMFP
jgi:hypothetical protein